MDTPLAKEFLEEILKNKIISFKASEGSKPGSGYMCVLISLEIDVADEPEPFHLLFKTFPSHPARQKILENMNLILKEFQVYSQFLPELIDFQKSVNGNSKILTPAVPTMVAGKAIDYAKGDASKWSELNPILNNFILMVDARKTDGFQMASKLESLNYYQVREVIVELAKLHAIGHAYKVNHKLANIRKKFPFITDRFYLDPKQRPLMVDTVEGNMKLVMQTCKEFLEKNPDMARSLEKFRDGMLFSNYLEEFLNPEGVDEEKMEQLKRVQPDKYSGPPLKEQWIVPGHGDAWTNNILFKNDETGKCCACLLVDMQEIRESCLMADLMYFVYTSTDVPFRKKHLDEMIRLYHQNFLEFCGILKVEPFPGFSLENLYRKFDRSKLFGFLFACVQLPIVLQKPETTKDMDSVQVEGNENGGSAVWAEMFQGLGRDEEDFKLLRDVFTDLFSEMYEQGIL